MPNGEMLGLKDEEILTNFMNKKDLIKGYYKLQSIY